MMQFIILYRNVGIFSYFRVYVYVDDEQAGAFRLPSGGSLIEDIENGGAIYVGGVPSNIDALSVAPTSRYLQGCISDITLNGRYVHVHFIAIFGAFCL